MCSESKTVIWLTSPTSKQIRTIPSDSLLLLSDYIHWRIRDVKIVVSLKEQFDFRFHVYIDSKHYFKIIFQVAHHVLRVVTWIVFVKVIPLPLAYFSEAVEVHASKYSFNKTP